MSQVIEQPQGFELYPQYCKKNVCEKDLRIVENLGRAMIYAI
jgi:hypothetical protein